MSETNSTVPVLLNLGSGQRPFPHPWVNVDAQEQYNPDVKGDLSDSELWEQMREAYPSGVDRICLHHTLEHFGLMEGKELVERCYSVLKPKGVLWVFVPDMKALAQAYTHGKLDHYQFAVNMYGAYMGAEWDRHKWGYDTVNLSRLLMGSGFRHVGMWDGGQTKWGADIAQDWWILGMEGMK